MLNANSPIVQSMIKNMPPDVLSNMEFYNGSPPTLETSYSIPQTQVQQQVISSAPVGYPQGYVYPSAPVNYPQGYSYPVNPVGYPNQPVQTPYPSPRDMVINQATQVYQPTPFAPRNIVGQYNPGYQQAFNGYTNPYMGYTAAPHQSQTKYVFQSNEALWAAMDTAREKNISLDRQAEIDSNICKAMTRVVNHALGKTEEEIKEREERYSLKTIHEINKIQQEPDESIRIHVQVIQNDKVIIDSKEIESKKNNSQTFGIKENYYLNGVIVERMQNNAEAASRNRILRNNYLYETAIERQFDNEPFIGFFNDYGYKIVQDSMMRQLKIQNLTRISELYNSDNFRKKLLENNGLRPREELDAVERFYGRYGVMPDGRPVSPGHDPAVAESFSYNAVTGNYEITAPKFIRERIENARRSFVQSIDS